MAIYTPLLINDYEFDEITQKNIFISCTRLYIETSIDQLSNCITSEITAEFIDRYKTVDAWIRQLFLLSLHVADDK